MVQRSAGICVGASTVSAVILEKNGAAPRVVKAESIAHRGSPKEALLKLLPQNIDFPIAVTGRKFRKLLNFESIPEPAAVELAANFLNVDADFIISAGGENFIIYELDGGAKIGKAMTGNKCASGTGEFFLQQIKRMDLSADEAARLALEGEPYNISGRCSVFCKSDCTHALNKGTPKSSVTAGLSRMMANKMIELSSKAKGEKAMLIGGVSKNKAVEKELRAKYPDLEIPKEAPYFEALGAAVYALEQKTMPKINGSIFRKGHTLFTFRDDLKKHADKVTFKDSQRGEASEGDVCILGLDVGSTTTKAVLIRKSDCAILASEYLRTNGDPVKASIECYESLRKQLQVKIKIIGLGATGSGRYIAGLHAQTKGIINEIIAHARATVYFDKEADTIFEIGGQDAKYTYITAGAPSDYAMNEACSAGTGSFLEEAAKESLGIDYKEIGEIAMQSSRPLNFNDQCSAFIGSDIKNALQEGLSKEDITAGLVYSIGLNYINRVKGNRPVGKKVFMQGGVCYNKAVPIALAALTGKEIIVPPDPGLMGAYGAALEIKNRIESGLLPEDNFDLSELIQRKVDVEKTFVCAGGAEKCDRKCAITIIKVNGKKFPFGGACNKYYNLQINEKEEARHDYNYVKLRQKLVFEEYLRPADVSADAPSIGISKSFLTNTYYPLYYNFFSQLGFNVILGDEPKPEGIDKRESAFCYPVELAHGFMQDLIDKKPDYIFLPHITEVPDPEDFTSKTCVLLQSEPYYLKSVFRKELDGIKLLSPVLDFSKGLKAAQEEFIKMGLELGKSRKESAQALSFALNEQMDMLAEFKRLGKEALSRLEEDTGKLGIVLFGRAYNSFAEEANLGIPQKFSSRNVMIIPHDFIASENLPSYNHMYWGTGRQILRSARFVKEHEQLFASYITNFSCGPDSFIIGYFRTIMGNKPSLTLELDSHSADAGINTRIEAALDIFRSFREIGGREEIKPDEFVPLKVKGEEVITPGGERINIKDKHVKMLVPNMGRYGSEAFSAAFRYFGINSEPLPVYTFETLIEGRGSASCKECLPLILNAGSMLEYYKKKGPGEIALFFMAEGNGPCRLGQYHVFLNDLITKKRLDNMAVFTLTDEDSYEGLGNAFVIRGWAAVMIGDVFQNILHAARALAEDREEAAWTIELEWRKIESAMEKLPLKEVYKVLENSALAISKLKRKKEVKDAVKIALTGEIFVRNDEFSRIDLMERLAEKEIAALTAPISEYVYYSNYLGMRKLNGKAAFGERVKMAIRSSIQRNIEKNIKKALAKSGFYEYSLINVKKIVDTASHLIRPELEGEAILTVGAALHEALDEVDGVISIGPFGCMPSRVAESVLNAEMNAEGKQRASGRASLYEGAIPFLAIETDGNMYPQIIQSKIEIFIMQAERAHAALKVINS
jgi:predicted CoA-substrate-specific enzyme activase